MAAARAGADVFIVGCVGQDAFAEQIMTFIEAENIDTSNVLRMSGKSTDIAFVTVDSQGENTIIYDGEYAPRISVADPDALIKANDVLISQYEFPASTVTEFFTRGRQRGSLNILNAAPAQPINNKLIDLADVIIVNEFELAVSAGLPTIATADRAKIEAAARALTMSPEKSVIVTLGADGAAVFDNDSSTWIDAIPVRPVDTTGAGDAFVGALGAALSTKCSMQAAARYANASASIAVTRKGAGLSMPFLSEVEAVLGKTQDAERRAHSTAHPGIPKAPKTTIRPPRRDRQDDG